MHSAPRAATSASRMYTAGLAMNSMSARELRAPRNRNPCSCGACGDALKSRTGPAGSTRTHPVHSAAGEQHKGGQAREVQLGRQVPVLMHIHARHAVQSRLREMRGHLRTALVCETPVSTAHKAGDVPCCTRPQSPGSVNTCGRGRQPPARAHAWLLLLTLCHSTQPARRALCLAAPLAAMRL